MKRILFISSNIHTPWGGSEVLWYKAALYLLRNESARVAVAARKWPTTPFHIQEISDAGGLILDLPMPPATPLEYLKSKYSGSVEYRRKKLVRNFSPDLIVHSMGKSFEGGDWMDIAHSLQIPYVNVIQLSSELQWPDNDEIEQYTRGYGNACKNLFVSHSNRELIARQLGMLLPQSDIVRNPITVARELIPYPDTNNGYRLALPAQLVPIHKGQDILFEVLARDKWRNRPLSLNLYGDGAHSSSLSRYCAYLGLENVHFRGYATDIAEVWSQNHMLIMTSRMEGLPLTLIEAMSCGRAAIVTAVAGMPECLEEGKTGFIAEAPHPGLVDEALERAWAAAGPMAGNGYAGGSEGKGVDSFRPCREFVKTLLNLEI